VQGRFRTIAPLVFSVQENVLDRRQPFSVDLFSLSSSRSIWRAPISPSCRVLWNPSVNDAFAGVALNGHPGCKCGQEVPHAIQRQIGTLRTVRRRFFDTPLFLTRVSRGFVLCSVKFASTADSPLDRPTRHSCDAIAGSAISANEQFA